MRGWQDSEDAGPTFRRYPAIELMWLALRITAAWRYPAPIWKTAMIQFALRYEGRFLAPSA